MISSSCFIQKMEAQVKAFLMISFNNFYLPCSTSYIFTLMNPKGLPKLVKRKKLFCPQDYYDL